MVAYLAEGIRYFRVAKTHCELTDDDHQNVFVSIVFTAMYIESVVNEVIFSDQLTAQMYEDYLGKKQETIELEIYEEMVPTIEKINLIMQNYQVTTYETDNELIELKHLIKLRNSLVHLKPIEQLPDGNPEKTMCKTAMNYLCESKKLIENPFDIGVFWTDVLMKREVADWALSVAVNSIEWMFLKTHDGALGNRTLSWHRQLITGKVGL